MHGPRDTPQLAVPVDPWTGWPLPQVKLMRLARLKEAEKAFLLVLNELDGSSEGTRPGERRMARAFDCVEEARMWAVAVVLEQ